MFLSLGSWYGLTWIPSNWPLAWSPSYAERTITSITLNPNHDVPSLSKLVDPSPQQTHDLLTLTHHKHTRFQRNSDAWWTLFSVERTALQQYPQGSEAHEGSARSAAKRMRDSMVQTKISRLNFSPMHWAHCWLQPCHIYICSFGSAHLPVCMA